MSDTIMTIAARPGSIAQVLEMEWSPHPVFPGVAMKHLVTGGDTGGTLSAHLVRIDPAREIGVHAHGENWETHQVLAGDGTCELEGETLQYQPGAAAVMPRSVTHRVIAGERTLLLLATFAPALL